MSQPRGNSKRPKTASEANTNHENDTSASASVAAGGGGGSNVIDREIPSSDVLRDMVNKSFRSGDHFSQWRGRYMKTFAVSYTQSLLRECVSEFVGGGSISSVGDIRTRTEEYVQHEMKELCDKKPALKTFCNAIVQSAKEDLESGDIQLPLRKYFVVGSISCGSGDSGSSERSMNVRLFVPFSSYVDLDSDMMSQWSGSSHSYFEAYKKICGLIQTMSLFKCADPSECRDHVHREFYSMLRTEGALRSIVSLNLEMNKHALEILLKKKEIHESRCQNLRDNIASSETLIAEYTRKLDAMHEKVEEVVSASDGFLMLLGGTNDGYAVDGGGGESCDFVVSVKRLFDAQSSKLMERLEKEKETRKEYEAALSEISNCLGGEGSALGKRKSGGGMGMYSMLLQRIRFYEYCCGELQAVLNDQGHMEKLVGVVELEFKLQLKHMDFMFNIVSSSNDNLKTLIRWMSKVISSQPMVFEGLFNMTEGVRRMLSGATTSMACD